MRVEKADKLIAPCGHYCGWCPYYVKRTEEFNCPGCWEKERCEWGIRECAQPRSLNLCTFCSEFPCPKLYELYSKMGEFFDTIKENFPKGIRQERPNQGGESHGSG